MFRGKVCLISPGGGRTAGTPGVLNPSESALKSPHQTDFCLQLSPGTKPFIRLKNIPPERPDLAKNSGKTHKNGGKSNETGPLWQDRSGAWQGGLGQQKVLSAPISVNKAAQGDSPNWAGRLK